MVYTPQGGYYTLVYTSQGGYYTLVYTSQGGIPPYVCLPPTRFTVGRCCPYARLRAQDEEKRSTLCPF